MKSLASSRLRFENPVLIREMRTRMRGSRAVWTITGYLIFLAMVLFFNYRNWWAASQGGGMSASSKIGQDFNNYITWVQAVLVALITPSLTAGAITIEREQQTLDLLELTKLSRLSIVLGKLWAALAFVSLLVLASLPLTAICFFLGGVSPAQVLTTYVLLIAGAFVTGSLGIAISAVTKTTAAAMSLSSGLLIATPIGAAIILSLSMRPAVGYSYEFIGMVYPALMGLIGGFLSQDLSQGLQSMMQWNGTQFFTLMIPAWVAPALIYGLTGLLLCTAAAARLERRPGGYVPLMRLLVVALVSVVSFYMLGSQAFMMAHPGGFSSGQQTEPIGFVIAMLFPCLLTCYLAPLCVTRDYPTHELAEAATGMVKGWSPKGLFRGGPDSGGLFLLALGLWQMALYAGAVLWTDRMVPGVRNALLFVPQITVGFLFFLLAIWTMGQLTSVVTRSKWAATCLTYLWVIGVTAGAGYYSYSNGFMSSGNPPSLMINIQYLNPTAYFWEVLYPDGRDLTASGLLFGAGAPMWAVGVIGYTMVAVLCLIACIPFIRRAREERSRMLRRF